MNIELIRRCPSCGTESAPSVMRCVCGMILAGVDIVRKNAAPTVIDKPAVQLAADAAEVVCPHDDCGQSNPPGSTICLYCNRPIAGGVTPAASELAPTESLQSLVILPAALRTRYRIVKPMPTRGAEAELLVVQAISGGPNLVAKIYRHGILPKRDVQERIGKIPVAHRVDVLEEGVSDGYAYELMELCEHGSLRQMMNGGILAPEILRTVIHELAVALQDVHSVGLVHRDLKPENILIRSYQPLDLVLTDFSISSILDVTQRFTGVARTLPYASPESMSGVIDFKCDFWAMGMLVLECATGKHPFAGLSEAVVMHHLTTRNIDLSAVTDRDVRRLLLGLLQRDPALRWGADEVQRWLNNDVSLADPAEHGSVGGFNEPYHIGNEVCYKPEQLAVALSRNWKEGVSDISNGLLLGWFRDVQKDQNVSRLLIDLRSQSGIHVDRQLLKLILHLAPGIPPVWRGETIELSTILTYANKALAGENEAAHWLDNLYQHRVLEVYAEAGNRQAADLVKRWHRAFDQFEHAWKTKLAIITAKSAARDPDEVADFDQLMYGRNEINRPSLASMHARLLAMSYDNSWAERLRKRILAEVLKLSSGCIWVNDLGDPLQMDAASLLVLEALLPEAKKSVEHQLKKMERNRKKMDREYLALRDEIRRVLSDIRSIASSQLATPSVSEELSELVGQYLNLVPEILASNRTDQEWLSLKKLALHPKVVAELMMDELGRLRQHRAITSGWLNFQTLGLLVLAIFLLPIFVPDALLWLSLLTLAIVVWRLLPDYWMMKSIRELGEAF
jgi:serine/threonine protein kinase